MSFLLYLINICQRFLPFFLSFSFYCTTLNMRVWFIWKGREKKMFHIRWFLLLIPNFNIASQYTSSKSLFLLLFRLSYVYAIPLSDMSEERRKRSWFVKRRGRRRRKKWRFFLFLESLTDVNQWKIFFCSFSLSLALSNHSKLSWSMMMVGSALSFDLDASRLIYTSNTWHFLQEEEVEKKLSFFLLITFMMDLNENNNNNNNNNKSSSNNGMFIFIFLFSY